MALFHIVEINQSKGEGDKENAGKTADVNKRAGVMGLIRGRKAFQRPMVKGWDCCISSRTCT